MIGGFHAYKIACGETATNLSLCLLKEGQEEIIAISNTENCTVKAVLQEERCK